MPWQKYSKSAQAIKENPNIFDYVEFMACPGGCIGGGGQPNPSSDRIIKKADCGALPYRLKMTMRKAHENPVVQEYFGISQNHSQKSENHFSTPATLQNENWIILLSFYESVSCYFQRYWRVLHGWAARRKVGITDFSFPLKTVFFCILEDIRPEGASGEATLTPESEYSAMRIFPGKCSEFLRFREILYCMSEILRETQNCFSIFEKPITPMVFIEIMIFKKKMMVRIRFQNASLIPNYSLS